MIRSATRGRPRPRSLRSGAFFVLAAVLGLIVPGANGPALAAQEPDTLRPAPPDTLPTPLPVDTLLPGPLPQGTPAQDTVPEDTIPPPPPALPDLAPLGPADWARGVWEWDRAALLRLPELTLLELLERVPGVVPVRSDLAGQAEGAAVLGATAGGIRWVLDGFELDPLVSPTFDPSRLPLLALQRVRVERRVTGVTVRLDTRTPDDGRTLSIIEAGTGDYGVNLFRGTFLAPRVLGGPLGLGFERLATDGLLPGGGSNHTATWLKWTWVRDSTGVQVELKRSDMDRSGIGDGLVGVRTDWVVRARSRWGGLTGELFAGGSSLEDDLGEVTIREGTPQGGARFRGDWSVPVPLALSGAIRLRSHPRLPAREAELGIRLAPLPGVVLEAEALQGWWTEGDATGRWTGRATLGPVLGLTLFGEATGGGALLGDGPEVRRPAAVDTIPPFAVSRDGARAGARLAWGGLVLGAAALRTSTDAVHPLGLPAEEAWGATGADGEATGLEATARIPTFWDPLYLEGWYVQLDAPDGWLYTPDRQARGALVYHHSPLASGNLELFGRVEHQYRGAMQAPALGGEAGGVGIQEVEAYRATNLEVVIRVLSVRAFIRWDNVRNRFGQYDLPGYQLPGQHILYGVKWEFWN